jgi:putative flippase GtrA
MGGIQTIRTQIVRFGIVGFSSNVTLYLLFILLVDFGLDEKIVVTVVYVIGLSLAFVFNRRWSFAHRGGMTKSLRRYLLLYFSLYLINVVVLWVAVGMYCFPHEVVQAIVVLMFIPIVFVMQRSWVFARKESPA